MQRLALWSVCLTGIGMVPAVSLCGDPVSLVMIQPHEHGTPPIGNVRLDILGARRTERSIATLQEAVADAAAEQKKSPWIAAGLSVVLPGAGEFYAESYWKSAAFFVVEAAIWTVAYIYDKKGDRQTDIFQDFANGHWSVWRYADYTEKNLRPPNGPYLWKLQPTDGPQPWLRVNWSELNRMERDIGGYYSHTLPYYGEQQYYELIGKYPQFNQGWDDAGPVFNYGDPLTSRFQYYADQRGKANTYYETATTMVTVAIVNHVISAVDAAISAGSYNSGLHAGMGVRTIPTASGLRTLPVLNLRYGL